MGLHGRLRCMDSMRGVVVVPTALRVLPPSPKHTAVPAHGGGGCECLAYGFKCYFGVVYYVGSFEGEKLCLHLV